MADSPRHRIVFVDDEPNILASLRRRLHGHRYFDAAFATSGEQALAILAQQPCDAIATDLHMPGMDGYALLATVKRRWPHMYRIVLSGSCEGDYVLRGVHDAHYFFGKPFDLDELQRVVSRVLRSRGFVVDPGLVAFATGLKHLPSLPDVYRRIGESLDDQSMSLRALGDLVAEDVALSAKVLRLVNSGFFGLPRHVSSPGEAAVLLGLDVVRALVLGESLHTSLDPTLIREGGLERLWEHSLRVARGTRALSAVLGCDKATADAAFQAASLHEVGRLVLLMNEPDAYLACCRESQTADECPIAVETRRLGCRHDALGAFLLGTWALPDDVVGAVANHRSPRAHAGATVDACCLLHLADSLDADHDGRGHGPDMDYLGSLGLADALPGIVAVLEADRHAQPVVST